MTSDDNSSGERGLLQLARHGDGDGVTLEVSGEVDLSNAAELEAALDDAFAAAAGRLIVDLGGLEFIDSTGLRSLLRFHQRDQSATEIVYRNPRGQVAEVLEITGLGSVLELGEDGQL
jgi:anti-sigma B factor antagonist